MTLTKVQIVDEILTKRFQSRQKTVEVVEILLEIIKQTLTKGEDVMISGFGKFSVREKNQRKGRNPATGDTLMLKPRRVITFKCSGKLRKQINGDV